MLQFRLPSAIPNGARPGKSSSVSGHATDLFKVDLITTMTLQDDSMAHGISVFHLSI